MSEVEYYPQEKNLQAPGVRFMSRLPRFSHGSDFSKLASSDQDEQADYVLGILAVSFFLLSAFIFFAAIILTCKCMGKRRVGLCSGRAHVISDANTGKFKPPSYLWKLRLFFISLGCGMIFLSVTLVGPGLRSVNAMQVSTRKLNRDVKDLITQGLLIMDSVKRVRWNIESLDVETLLRVEEACPNLESNTFISDKILSQSIAGVDKEFDELKVYLEESDLETIRSHIDKIQIGTEYIDVAVTTVEENDWMIRMFALVLNVLVFFMILSACLSPKCTFLPALKCMTELFILPMFVVVIVGSWMATSVLAFASISNADFCSGTSQQAGPAGTVMNIFEERGMKSDDIIFTGFTYYQSECVTEDPIKHLYQYEDDLQSGIGSASDFLTKVDEIGLDEINEQCGANVYRIIEGVGLIKDNLGILLGALRSTYELASCAKMSPLYTQAFEGTACTDSSGSLTLIFSIMFGISCLGVLMIMLRSAMYPYKKVYSLESLDDDEQDEWQEYQAYLQYMASFVSMWGGNEDDAASTKEGTAATFSASGSTLKPRSDTPSTFLHTVDSSSTINSDDNEPDEESPLSPQTPALDVSSFRRGRNQDGIHDEEDNNLVEDEERMPLSPASNIAPDSMNLTLDQSGMYTPDTKQRPDRHSDGFEDNEGAPFTPQNPISRASAGQLNNRRFRTPDFLTPGRFTRWRHHDEDDVEDGLPETPLMTSPRTNDHERVNYFGDAISPLRRGSVEENRTVKID